MKNNWLLIIICFVFGNGQIYGQCACCAGAGIGSSNGDAGTGLLNIPKKTGIAELYGDYRSIQTGEHIHQHGDDDESILESMAIGLVGVRYGISRRVTIGALLPYVFLQSETGNDRGLGDMILQGTFGVWRKSQFEVAIQAGLELPTGIRKSSNFDNTTVVVGSGSWDPMLGVFSPETGVVGLYRQAVTLNIPLRVLKKTIMVVSRHITLMSLIASKVSAVFAG